MVLLTSKWFAPSLEECAPLQFLGFSFDHLCRQVELVVVGFAHDCSAMSFELFECQVLGEVIAWVLVGGDVFSSEVVHLHLVTDNHLLQFDVPCSVLACGILRHEDGASVVHLQNSRFCYVPAEL
jgi:hypothetical protein